MGAVPPGYRAEYDEQGNPVQLVPIPGGPVDVEQRTAAEAAGAQEEARQTGQAGTASTMLQSVQDIRGVFADANTPVTGTLSVPFALYSGSPAGRVRSYVKALQSGVALQAMTRLKEASATGATGFGALSERELEVLISEVGALNPDTTEPDIFLQTLDRIEQRYQRVVDDIRKNVSPERIRELGLEPFIVGVQGMGDGAGPGAPADGSGIVDYRTYFGTQ
jgi:hypothetical protein